MIQAQISKEFAARTESAGFSLDVEFTAGPGITVLFGPSGSGKTLTLDCIAGFVRPDRGRILLDDLVLFDSAAGIQLPPRSRHTGYVFQNYALFPHMTLRENLEFALARTPRPERLRRINDMLERFRIAEVAGRRPHELSGGQKQRCSIARALIGAPRLLLLDEPARGLDAPLRTEFYAVLRQAQADFGTPAVLVTHDLEECMELGHAMLAMRNGRLEQSGTPRQVFDRPASIAVARMLGRYNLARVEIRALDPGQNSSRLCYQGFELQGPYFAGRSIGDCVWLCTLPEQLRAVPRDGVPAGANRIPAALLHVTDTSQGQRLEFSGDLAVQVCALPDDYRQIKDWWIEFPPGSLRVV